MRPRPTTPSVLPVISTPLNLLFSQRWPFNAMWACGILRASANNIAMACSAVVVVEPPGEFITKTPCSVAASISTLSTPTPARPTTLRRLVRWSKLRSTMVALRTITPSKFGMISRSLSRAILSCTTGVIERVRSITSMPAGSIPSSKSTLRFDIADLEKAREFTNAVQGALDVLQGIRERKPQISLSLASKSSSGQNGHARLGQ